MGELLRSHIVEVRKLHGFDQAMAIVIVESNLPHVAPAIAQYISSSSLPNVIMMREDVEPYHSVEIRPGSRTNEKNRVAMLEMLRDFIARRAMLVHKHFVNSQPEYSMYVDPERQMFNQLRGFTLVSIVNARDATARTKKVYTGKLNGGKDDACMSLADNCYHYGVFMTADKYAGYRR